MNIKKCVCVCARARRGGIGGCCLCSGIVCLSPWCLLPHILAFQKVTGIVYSAPDLGASQGAEGTCLSSGVYQCVWLPSSRPSKIHAHTHSHGCGDHVGCHRMSLNPRISQNLGAGRLAPHRDKDDTSTAPGDTPWI
uniref:Uncharacterized protein n=1 Tax=Molossus molossus TaxID=27622 RepID=A0A7J8I7T9_MOLMO|nr:hypothetical protein HJG59_010566 [Molossus molossus]